MNKILLLFCFGIFICRLQTTCCNQSVEIEENAVQDFIDDADPINAEEYVVEPSGARVARQFFFPSPFFSPFGGGFGGGYGGFGRRRYGGFYGGRRFGRRGFGRRGFGRRRFG